MCVLGSKPISKSDESAGVSSWNNIRGDEIRNMSFVK